MIQIEDFAVDDLKEAMALWRCIPELHFPVKCDDKDILTYDSEEKLTRFLLKNEKLSTVAKSGDKIVGALLCGDDGRWGYFHYTGVHPDFRGRKIGTRMVEYTFDKLRKNGINACYLFTYHSNLNAQAFWKSIGFSFSPEVMFQSRAI